MENKMKNKTKNKTNEIMMKLGVLGIIIIVAMLGGCIQPEKTSEEYCTGTGTGEKLSLPEAKQIALNSKCVENGTLKETYFCNNATGTWWIDLDIKKERCNPACVVDAATKQAEINWRCTGLLPPESEQEKACINSMGSVKTEMCCKSASDFPNLCLIGACGCASEDSHEVKICNCGEGKCFDGNACVPEVNNFDDCIKAGYPVMESYPRQCRTPDGKTFTEEISICTSDDECVPAACCHPSECVHENQAPDCEGVACTMECRSGTMDCGYGHCACIDNKCMVVWTGEAGEGHSCSGMTLEEAGQIAIDSECGDQLKEAYFCNNATGTWWIDLDIEKEGCSPACVVNVATKQAEINWRCTGLIPVGVANPAAEYCQKAGYEYKIEDTPEGQRGLCKLQSGEWVDEWELYRNKTKVTENESNNKADFCGRSVNGVCSLDSDCTAGGCSGQICQSKNERPIMTTCEWRDCYNAGEYNLTCKCVGSKCEWA